MEREQSSDTPRSEGGGITGWIERRGRTLASLGSGAAKDGLSAKAGIVVAGSGLAAEIGYRQTAPRFGSFGVQLDAMLSVRMYQEYRAAVGLIGQRTSTAAVDAAETKAVSLFNDSAVKAPGSAYFVDVRYRNYPRQTFYGVGIDSRRHDRGDYALTGTSVDAVWQKQVSGTLGWSVRAGLLDLDVGTGRDASLVNVEDRFPQSEVPGRLNHPRFLTLGAGLAYDTRADPGRPQGGAFLAVSVRRFESVDAADVTRLAVDGRTYWTPPGPRAVVALRGVLSSDHTGRNGRTPFYLQESLGGGETLRGFASYRFQDQAFAHATLEYRWRVHRFVDVAPFVDAGTVAPGASRLALGAVKVSPGIGIRAGTDRRTLFRLDWARSAEGHRFILATGPLF